jgi:hypothetical protein
MNISGADRFRDSSRLMVAMSGKACAARGFGPSVLAVSSFAIAAG